MYSRMLREFFGKHCAKENDHILYLQDDFPEEKYLVPMIKTSI